ncbi:hypothetical protein Tco_1117525 [Tanacetum coccineum]
MKLMTIMKKRWQKKATNQKTNVEFDPFDDPEFEKYFIENEHLFVPTQPRAKNKKDQTNDEQLESFFDNEEENIRKAREFFDELRKKDQHQERERQRKEKKKRIKYDHLLRTVLFLEEIILSKTVDPSVPLTDDEKLLGKSIFSTQQEEEEEVFNDDERTILFRMNILSLAPRLEIDIQVPGILEDKTKEIENKIDAQYVHEMLSIQMQNDVEKMKMVDVELAFFPIIAHDHYYLIVFNLKTGKPVIIKNSEI